MIVFTRQNQTALKTLVINDIRISYLVFQNHWYWLIMTHIGAKQKQFDMSVDSTDVLKTVFRSLASLQHRHTI